MRSLTILGAAAILAAAVVATIPTDAAAKVRVVASFTDLKALTEAVGGDQVEVDSLARGNQNTHDIEVRPSLMLKLRRADLLVRNGVGLDFWVEPLVVGSQNARLLPGAPGYVDTSRGIRIIAPDGPVDRSRGDVHPEGNPHYTLDPANAAAITGNIVEGLKRAAPERAAYFEARRRDFLAKVDTAMERWQKALEPFRSARIVIYHDNLTYFLRRFGLEAAGTIEDRPGIPPSPGHLANLIRTIREQKIKVVVVDPFADQRVAELVARDSGARLLVLPTAVGGVKGVDGYVELFEHNVKALVDALR